MNVNNEAGLGLAIHWVEQAIISAYKDNCPRRPVKTSRKYLKCAVVFESRRRVRWFFSKCRPDKNPHRLGSL